MKQIIIPVTISATVPDDELCNPSGNICSHLDYGEYRFTANMCMLFKEFLNKKEGDDYFLMKCRSCKTAWEKQKKLL